MGWLQLIKSLPAILGMLLQLKQLWDAFLVNEDKNKKMQELTEAIKNARVNKDTSKLTELVNDIVTGQPPPG